MQMTRSVSCASTLALLALVVPGAGHGLLSQPAPRRLRRLAWPGPKLPNFNDAKGVADRGCGGTANADPGVQLPTVSYRPGEIMRIEWEITIPHPADVQDTGIRVAIHYGPQDSFDRNVLIGGVLGDPDFVDGTGDGIIDRAVPAGPADAAVNSTHSTIVTLPDKTCNYCTVQWVWAARADNGFYVGCADISITATGLLPDFINGGIPSEVGNELPQNAPPAPPGTVRSNGGGGGGGAAVPIVIVLLLIVGGGGGYYYYQKKQQEDGGMTPVPKATVPGTMVGAAPPLPQGWTAAVDPTSGRTYYSNTVTGATQWEPPAGAQPAPPPGAPPAPGSLPPGWVEAKDEGSGRPYFINTATNASTWERPTNRF